MITLHGARLETARWGTPSPATPTLVLLHEGLGCVELWRDFPARLADATRLAVFAWSRPGYGRSDPIPLPRPLDYLDRAARDDVPRVLDAAGIGPCILLGHSDGASIAIQVRDPRITALVLISPHYFVEPTCLAAIAQARDAYATGDLRPRLAKYHDHPDTAFHGWNDTWLHPDFSRWNIRPAAQSVTLPILQLQGADDPYGTPAQTDTLTAPNVTTAILPAKHAPHLEAAEAALAEIVGFLARSVAR